MRAVNKNGVFRKETGKVARPKSKQELEPYTTMLTVGLRERIKDLAYEIRKSGNVEPKAAEIIRAALQNFFSLSGKKQFELVAKETEATRGK